MKELLESEQGDVLIKYADGERGVLSHILLKLDYFQALLNSGMKESETKTISFANMSGNVLKILLHQLYLNTIPAGFEIEEYAEAYCYAHQWGAEALMTAHLDSPAVLQKTTLTHLITHYLAHYPATEKVIVVWVDLYAKNVRLIIRSKPDCHSREILEVTSDFSRTVLFYAILNNKFLAEDLARIYAMRLTSEESQEPPRKKHKA